MVYRRRSSGGGAGIRLIIGLIIAVISIVSYLGSQEFNPVTGENQYVSLTPEQEIAMGLQAVPEITQEFGGELRDPQLQALVDQIGAELVNNSVARNTPWPFEFTVLNDPQTVNAFALPGGPVFITSGLINALSTEEEVAGVLAHEIVHVLARHSSQQIAQNELSGGLVGAVGVASGSADAARTAQVIGQLISMRYSRSDETQSDTLGVCLMIDSGYDPEAMVEVMRVLQAASGGASQPEFFSTHPNPENRIAAIAAAIEQAPMTCPTA